MEKLELCERQFRDSTVDLNLREAAVEMVSTMATSAGQFLL